MGPDDVFGTCGVPPTVTKEADSQRPGDPVRGAALTANAGPAVGPRPVLDALLTPPPLGPPTRRIPNHHLDLVIRREPGDPTQVGWADGSPHGPPTDPLTVADEVARRAHCFRRPTGAGVGMNSTVWRMERSKSCRER
jgi:hypothetical protein